MCCVENRSCHRIGGLDNRKWMRSVLKSLNVQELSWLTQLCNIAWRSGTVDCNGRPVWWSQFLIRVTGDGSPTIEDHTPQPSRESLFQGTGEDDTTDSQPSDSGETMQTLSWSRNTRRAPHSPSGAPGFMGVCSTGPHVLCRFGEDHFPSCRGLSKSIVSKALC